LTTILILLNSYRYNFNFNFINKLFTVFTINKSPFKGSYFNILLIIGIITSLIIRLDYIYNLLQILPYELNVSIRLSSALYSILILFLLMINIKQFKDFYKYFINLEIKKISILILYNIYFIYISIVSLIILIINYQSVLSLNIEYLNIIFLSFSIISLLSGIYYSIYRFNSEFNLNRTLSITGRITFISFILIYLSLFIGLRSGIILDWINKFELIETIHCESSGSSNLNSRLRNNEDGTIGTISNNNNNSNSNNSGGIVGNNNSVNVGDNSTASNITVNPSTTSNNNIPNVTATRTTIRTETIISPANIGNSSELSSDSTLPVYSRNNNNNNSLPLTFPEKGKEAIGIFNKELKNKSDSLLSSNSDTDSDIIEIETEEHKESMKPIYFENFKNLSQKEKFNYIYQKMYNKAIDPNKYLIEWLINSTLNNTNGNKLEIDNYIEINLNKIQKNERESQLMSHAFERTRPYPITRIDPSPHAFPVYMPMKKDMDDWDSQELIDAMNNINKEYEEIEESSLIKDSISKKKSITIESNNEKNENNK